MGIKESEKAIRCVEGGDGEECERDLGKWGRCWGEIVVGEKGLSYPEKTQREAEEEEADYRENRIAMNVKTFLVYIYLTFFFPSFFHLLLFLSFPFFLSVSIFSVFFFCSRTVFSCKFLICIVIMNANKIS